MASSRASTVGSEMNASTPICSGRLRMLVRKWKLGGWITTPADRIALLRTCLRLRSLRAPCGEKENNNRKWSHYWPETKIRPCPKIGTSSLITGNASDSGGQVWGVEVSTDGGNTWQSAVGQTSWSFAWIPAVSGSATIKSRAFDDSGNLGAPGPGVTVSVVGTPRVL
jgi:hypothetical protein